VVVLRDGGVAAVYAFCRIMLHPLSPKYWEKKEQDAGLSGQPAGQLCELLCECDACMDYIRAPNALLCPVCDKFNVAVGHTCPDCAVPEQRLYDLHSDGTSTFGYDSDGNMVEVYDAVDCSNTNDTNIESFSVVAARTFRNEHATPEEEIPRKSSCAPFRVCPRWSMRDMCEYGVQWLRERVPCVGKARGGI
jgi:hypothetical protein